MRYESQLANINAELFAISAEMESTNGDGKTPLRILANYKGAKGEAANKRFKELCARENELMRERRRCELRLPPQANARRNARNAKRYAAEYAGRMREQRDESAGATETAKGATVIGIRQAP